MSEIEPAVDVTTIRNERTQSLREKVLSAFNNRRKTHFVNQRADEISVSRAEKQEKN